MRASMQSSEKQGGVIKKHKQKELSCKWGTGWTWKPRFDVSSELATVSQNIELPGVQAQRRGKSIAIRVGPQGKGVVLEFQADGDAALPCLANVDGGESGTNYKIVRPFCVVLAVVHVKQRRRSTGPKSNGLRKQMKRIGCQMIGRRMQRFVHSSQRELVSLVFVLKV